jgi:hypothetical protein
MLISRKLHQDFPVALIFPNLHPGFVELSKCSKICPDQKFLMGPKSQGSVERFSRASEAKGLAFLASSVGAENFAGVGKVY